MGWSFLNTDGALAKFVTSDNPLVLEDVGEGPAQSLGIRNPNIEITMPLSSSVVAVAAWDETCSYGSLPPESIEQVNQRTIDRANRFVYASFKSEDLLARVVESEGRQARTIVRKVEKNGATFIVSAYVG